MLVAPKNLKYNQDGTGRDQYIYMDNGGYYPRLKETILLKDPGSYSKTIYNRPAAASLMNRPKRYCNNGTGRDSYIYCDDGGYCPGATKPHFLKTLRSSTLTPPKHRTTSYNSKKDMYSTIALSREQKEQSIKLSRPKSKLKCFEHSQDNPQEQNSSNYELRQTTKWQTVGFTNGMMSRKELFRLIKNKTARQ